MTDSDSDAVVVHPLGPSVHSDARRALVEQFLRNGEAGDDAANSDLVAAVCAGIRRAQDAARAGAALPGAALPGAAAPGIS